MLQRLGENLKIVGDREYKHVQWVNSDDVKYENLMVHFRVRVRYETCNKLFKIFETLG